MTVIVNSVKNIGSRRMGMIPSLRYISDIQELSDLFSMTNWSTHTDNIATINIQRAPCNIIRI
jgi:hypothetical protein